MVKSLEQLLTSSVDHSGLLVKSKEELREVLKEYVEFANSPYRGMLSKFVIPHNYIPLLAQFADRKHLLKGPLSLCVKGPETETIDDFRNALKDIEKEILSAHSGYPGEVRTPILELKLPDVSVENLNPENLVKALEAVVTKAAESRLLPHRVFFELPAGQKNIEAAKKITKVIAVHNKSILKRKVDNYLFSGLKINCSDHDGKNVPDANYLAEVMLYARDANVALKFSGAENTPFPSYNYSNGSRVHGFINVLVGSMLSYTQDLNLEETISIIDDKNPENFSFKDGYIAWKGLAAPTMEIKMLRMLSITSFNMNTLRTPIHGLKDLALIL
jgi:hypothetical protein